MKEPRSNNENPGAGAEFEKKVKTLFSKSLGIKFDEHEEVSVGVGNIKKQHRFDLVSKKPGVIVECKNYSWTTGGNSPSAKLGFLNEVMLYFLAAPQGYRKILVMRMHKRNGLSLANHYVKTYAHLIPSRVEIWEVDGENISRVY